MKLISFISIFVLHNILTKLFSFIGHNNYGQRKKEINLPLSVLSGFRSIVVGSSLVIGTDEEGMYAGSVLQFPPTRVPQRTVLAKNWLRAFGGIRILNAGVGKVNGNGKMQQSQLVGKRKSSTTSWRPLMWPKSLNRIRFRKKSFLEQDWHNKTMLNNSADFGCWVRLWLEEEEEEEEKKKKKQGRKRGGGGGRSVGKGKRSNDGTMITFKKRSRIRRAHTKTAGAKYQM